MRVGEHVWRGRYTEKLFRGFGACAPGEFEGSGAAVFVFGALLALAGKLPWLGRLRGDILVERGPVTFYLPIVTCVIVSVVLSLLLWLFRR